jgi:hypothetical protein
MFQYISIPVFLLSFAVGLIFIYLLGPEMKSVYVYPSPENIDKFMVKDKANNCFTFQEKTVQCPKDDTLLSSIPIQL